MMIRNIWPINPPTSFLDKLALKVRGVPGFCNICGVATLFIVNDPNFREHVICLKCRSRNRQRQLVAVLLSQVKGKARKFASIKAIPPEKVVWNTESTKSLHERLSAHLKQNYISSEYIDPSLESGETQNGVLHVDIQKTHFADNSIDYILSSDVMEHVPFPMQAFEETYRILKPGGCHIFTAPFYFHRATNEKRALINDRGETEYLLKPWYHDDPLRQEGVLVYNVFAPEILSQLESVGFEAKLCLLHSRLHGILGSNGVVMVARKVTNPSHKIDFIFP